MRRDTYDSLMAAADRAETHCGPGFARRIRERAEAIRTRDEPLAAARAQLDRVAVAADDLNRRAE